MYARPISSYRKPVEGTSHCPVGDRCVIASACTPAEDQKQSVVCQRLHLERGALIWCYEGESTKCVFTIRSGVAALLNYSVDGTESILGFLYEGQAFGLTHLFSKEIRPLIARAFTKVELCKLPICELERLVKTDPEVAKRVIRSLSDGYWGVVQQIKLRDILRARDRVRISLQQLAEKLDRGRGEVELPLTHEEIARLVGVNRVTITRVLHELEEEGLVELGHRSLRVFTAAHFELKDSEWKEPLDTETAYDEVAV
jgi:CRP/FNR family cyclic AMP-dependent transcriptional regulator